MTRAAEATGPGPMALVTGRATLSTRPAYLR
jgi:hypothetical protein